MKKIWLMAALLVAGMMAFVSCGKDDKEPTFSSSDLVGTWVTIEEIYVVKMAGMTMVDEKTIYAVEDQESKMTFKADGTFVDEEDGSTGTWTLNGNKLKMVYSDEEYGVMEFKILKLDGSKAILEMNEVEEFMGVKTEVYSKTTHQKI